MTTSNRRQLYRERRTIITDAASLKLGASLINSRQLVRVPLIRSYPLGYARRDVCFFNDYSCLCTRRAFRLDIAPLISECHEIFRHDTSKETLVSTVDHRARYRALYICNRYPWRDHVECKIANEGQCRRYSICVSFTHVRATSMRACARGFVLDSPLRYASTSLFIYRKRAG